MARCGCAEGSCSCVIVGADTEAISTEVTGNGAPGTPYVVTSEFIGEVGTGIVVSVVPGTNIDVDSTDPANPIVSLESSPALAGNPTTPDQSAGDNSSKIANTKYVDTASGLLVPKSLFNANTILIATTDDTPIPLTVGASTFVGRKAAGDIVAMTPAEAKALLDTVLGTYTTYSPTVSQNGTRTTSAMVARYIQIGKMVHAWGGCTFSNAGTSGNAVSCTLPVAANVTGVNNSHMAIGTAYYSDTGSGNYLCHAVPDGPSGASGFVLYSTLAAANVVANRLGVSPALAVASGDLMSWDLIYEAA